MPQIQQVLSIDIHPEKLVSRCDLSELYELIHLAEAEIIRRERKAEFESLKPKPRQIKE